MSTSELVGLAAALEKAKHDDYSPTTYSEYVAEAEKRGLIVVKEIRDLSKQISITSHRIFERQSKSLSAALKWRERVQAYSDGVAQFQLTGDRKTWDNLNRNLDSAIKESKKILHEHAQVDVPYYNSLRSVAQSNQKGGTVEETAAWFKAALDTNPFQLGAGESTYDFGDPGVRAAHRDFFKKINSQGRYIFDIAPEGADDAGMIRNLAELSNPKASEKGGILHGLMSGAGIQIILEDNQHNQLEAYNRDQKTGNDTKKLVADQVQKTQAIRDSMGAPDLSPERYFELSNQAREHLIGIEEVANKRGQFDIDDMEQLKTELADITELREQNEILKTQQRKLIEGSPSRADTLKRDMAHTISSPWFHAWAADHGFEELGRVDGDENNKLLVDTYVQGRDDLNAMKAFVREQERGAGRYGFRSIGSGETVQVTIDGEVITGERLKYHAGDRPGVVRIAVPDREEPILIVSPGDVDGPIVVLSTDRDKVSPGVNRAKALLFRKGGAIKAAGQDAPRVDVASVAKVGEEFIVDESGQHVDAASYAEQVEAALSSRVVAKVVDNQTYLVDSDGTVYQIDESTGEPTATIDEGSAEFGRIMEAPSHNVYTTRTIEGDQEGVAVLTKFTPEDPETFLFFPKGEEPDFLDQVEAERVAEITPDSLGYSLVSEFRPEKAQTYENPRNVGGMQFATLKDVPGGRGGAESTTVAEPVSEPEVPEAVPEPGVAPEAPVDEVPEAEAPVDEAPKPSPEALTDEDLETLGADLAAEAKQEAALETKPTPVPAVETPEPKPPIHDDPEAVEAWLEPEFKDKATAPTDRPLDVVDTFHSDLAGPDTMRRSTADIDEYKANLADELKGPQQQRELERLKGLVQDKMARGESPMDAYSEYARYADSIGAPVENISERDQDKPPDQASADAPATEPDKKKARLGDVVSQLIFPRKKKEEEEAKASQDKREAVDQERQKEDQERQKEDQEQSRKEQLAKRLAMLETLRMATHRGEPEEPTDETQGDANKVRPPIVTGKNTPPPETPKTQTADELAARRAAAATDTVPINTTTNRYQNRGRGVQ